MPLPPRFRCPVCQDWGTVVPRDGGQPIPCPEPDCPIRKTTTGKTR